MFILLLCLLWFREIKMSRYVDPGVISITFLTIILFKQSCIILEKNYFNNIIRKLQYLTNEKVAYYKKAYALQTYF